MTLLGISRPGAIFQGMAETTYRVVKQPDSTYSVEIISDFPRRGAGGFRTEAEAEGWIRMDKIQPVKRPRVRAIRVR